MQLSLLGVQPFPTMQQILVNNPVEYSQSFSSYTDSEGNTFTDKSTTLDNYTLQQTTESHDDQKPTHHNILLHNGDQLHKLTDADKASIQNILKKYQENGILAKDFVPPPIDFQSLHYNPYANYMSPEQRYPQYDWARIDGDQDDMDDFEDKMDNMADDLSDYLDSDNDDDDWEQEFNKSMKKFENELEKKASKLRHSLKHRLEKLKKKLMKKKDKKLRKMKKKQEKAAAKPQKSWSDHVKDTWNNFWDKPSQHDNWWSSGSDDTSSKPWWEQGDSGNYTYMEGQTFGNINAGAGTTDIQSPTNTLVMGDVSNSHDGAVVNIGLLI